MEIKDHENDRHLAIRDQLFARGETPLPDLADALGVSIATIRRDVLALEQQGIVSRSRGAVRIAEPGAPGAEVAFGLRDQTELAAKRAIASAALQLTRPGETLILDAGTTVLQVARYLRLHPRPMSIFTNSIAIATELAQVPQISLTLFGGRLRAANMSLVGPAALEMLEKIHADRLFLGASALSPDGRLSSFDADEAQVNAAMMRRAARCYVLSDSSKFGLRATYDVGALGAGAALVTERAPQGALAEVLRAAQCQIHLPEQETA